MPANSAWALLRDLCGVLWADSSGLEAATIGLNIVCFESREIMVDFWAEVRWKGGGVCSAQFLNRYFAPLPKMGAGNGLQAHCSSSLVNSTIFQSPVSPAAKLCN